MTIANIIGGLGNQMFQYAASKALCIRHKRQLKLCIREFDRYKLHDGFELARIFGLKEEIATEHEVHAQLGPLRFPVLQKLFRALRIPVPGRVGLVLEPHYEFWPGLDSIEKDAFLRGYWQSFRYFENEAAEIRSLFSFAAPLDSLNERLSAQLANSESVSIHVRRGDYLKGWRNRRRFSRCTLDYYTMGIDYLRCRLSGLKFFIFTDDSGWVRQNLCQALSDAVLIDHNRAADSYRDMQLMSCAKHNIIANSSFSWWGAWLNTNPGKNVVAPGNWFCDGQSTHDLIPETWITLQPREK